MIGTRTAPIRLALTLLGLRYCVCTAGVRPLIHCSADSSGGTTGPLITASAARNSFCTTTTSGQQTMLSSAAAAPPPHVKSRCSQYPGSQVKRFPVPDDKVAWSAAWPQYAPVNYTAPSVTKRPPWADPEIGFSHIHFSPRFNAVDGAVDRASFEGDYRVEQGKPLNPRGRTGLTERGLLGRWGPNHAADPIVTRWKLDAKGQKISHPVSKRPVLQFVAIKRIDCGEWAIPGGMVDPGELVSLTLQREFSEEALNSLKASPSERADIHARITQLFNSPGFQVYQGYVDDPRNTDNAWMETVAVNFHDDEGSSVSGLPLEAGDDAGKVRWVDVDSSFSLYASHNHFLEAVAKERHAHW